MHVADGEKMCSNFCSALGMLSTSPGKSCNDIYQINKTSRGVSVQTDWNSTASVHVRTVIWNQSVVVIKRLDEGCSS